MIELAIVLVIIGLVTGAILAGKDMLKSAQNRKLVSQLEDYGSAVNTFRIKYNGLPGDLSSSLASQFGMQPRAGGAGHGDGNALYEACVSGSSIRLGCETVLFWRDLSDAQLISQKFTTATDALVTIATGSGDMDLYIPRVKSDSSGLWLHSYQGKNYLLFFEITQMNGSGYTGNYNTTMDTAFYLDTKIDDGLALSGSVDYENPSFTALRGGGPGPQGSTWAINLDGTYNVGYRYGGPIQYRLP